MGGRDNNGHRAIRVIKKHHVEKPTNTGFYAVVKVKEKRMNFSTKHPTFKSAVEEARRLAEETGQLFVVIKTVTTVRKK